jgi:hypothetical protein
MSAHDTHQPRVRRSSHARTDDPSPYRRDEWWGREDPDRPAEANSLREWVAERVDPNDPADVVAMQLLTETATMLCGRTLDQEERAEELTEPCIYPPTESAAEMRHRKRYNPKNGRISAGESTYCVLKDRPVEEFLAVVETYLWGAQPDLHEWERETALELAEELKRHDDGKRDRQVLREVIRRVRADELERAE